MWQISSGPSSKYSSYKLHLGCDYITALHQPSSYQRLSSSVLSLMLSSPEYGQTCSLTWKSKHLFKVMHCIRSTWLQDEQLSVPSTLKLVISTLALIQINIVDCRVKSVQWSTYFIIYQESLKWGNAAKVWNWAWLLEALSEKRVNKNINMRLSQQLKPMCNLK